MSTVLDPTRIDRVLNALRHTWEGQPDISLPTLFAMLANQGIGWGTTDDQLLEALESMALAHPPLIPQPIEGSWLLQTTQPAALVTLHAQRVVVRSFMTQETGTRQSALAYPLHARQPVVWNYRSARPLGPGRPVVLTDTSGQEHRLGLCTHLTKLLPVEPSPEGLLRTKIGERVYIVVTQQEEDEQTTSLSTVVIDRSLSIFIRHNRRLEQENFSWQRVEQCQRGKSLIISLEDGSRLDAGVVRSIDIAGAPTVA